MMYVVNVQLYHIDESSATIYLSFYQNVIVEAPIHTYLFNFTTTRPTTNRLERNKVTKLGLPFEERYKKTKSTILRIISFYLRLIEDRTKHQ